MHKSILSNKESLVKKAGYLRIVAADIAENMKSGNFKSLYKGHGVEFSGVRDYIRGDDIRAIDWNVTARMGHPYVKLFNEEREMQIFLIVDTSASMFLNTGNKIKYEAAAEAAAIMAIAAEINNCPAGAVLFDGDVYFSCKPALSKVQTMSILTKLDRLYSGSKFRHNTVTGSVLGTALSGAEKILKTRSLVFVFSDFRSTGWERPLISLAHKNNVIALRLTDAYDKKLPEIGSAVFQDVESGIKMELPSSSEKFKKAWLKFNESGITSWSDCCRKHGIMPVLFESESDPLQVLNSVFVRKMKSGKI